MNTPAVAPPAPRINALNRPFWDGCEAGVLRLQRCMNPACSRAVYYPRVCCPYCQAGDLAWTVASGRGRVITHTTVRRTHHDGFNRYAPYVFAAIALEEGPCFYARLVDAPLEESLIDRAVRVRMEAGDGGTVVPVFALMPD
jgi:uncharacterized OB-fold protein